jgi:hypothetical protein
VNAPWFRANLAAGNRCHALIPALALLLLVTGCAHPLAIGPDLTKIERSAEAEVLSRNVGYFIAPNARERTVTTPGGGGDMVTYSPYKDVEAAFYKMLATTFKNVALLKSPTDADAIQKHSISYVISPEITTDSSSSSALTWPPTLFVLNLTCSIADPSGKLIAKPSVTGAGRAEFDEFKSDFSLAGKRAVVDAMLKMQNALLNLPELKNP